MSDGTRPAMDAAAMVAVAPAVMFALRRLNPAEKVGVLTACLQQVIGDAALSEEMPLPHTAAVLAGAMHARGLRVTGFLKQFGPES